MVLLVLKIHRFNFVVGIQLKRGDSTPESKNKNYECPHTFNTKGNLSVITYVDWFGHTMAFFLAYVSVSLYNLFLIHTNKYVWIKGKVKLTTL